MQLVRTDWTAEEIERLLESANTRTERVDGTLLVSIAGHIVQLAVIPATASDVPDMGDAEYTLEVFETALPFPIPSGLYRAFVVGRVPEPREPFQETRYDANGQVCYRLRRVLDYPLLRSTTDRNAPAEIRNGHGKSRSLTVTEEFAEFAIPNGVHVMKSVVVTRTPYAREFPLCAKKLGGRWSPDYRVWVFPRSAEDAVRALVAEVYER
jgi:hypothetical protein